MAKKKATGMSKRVGFLDRDTVNENREILRYNQKVEREERRAAQQEEAARRTQKVQDTLFKGVSFADDNLKEAGDQLLNVVARGGRFGEGAKAGWELLKSRIDDTALESARLQWNRIVHEAGVNAEREKLTRVPAGILKEVPVVDPVKSSLITVGLSQPNGTKVKKLVLAYADFLTKGEKARDAITHAWRVGTRGLEPQVRQELSSVWAKVGSVMAEEWAKTHPGDTLPSAQERRQERQAKLETSLRRAGEKVPSWPIFELEGEVLVKALAKTLNPKEALQEASVVLGERKPKVSPTEWSVIKAEWAKITEAVLGEFNTRQKR